MAEEEPKAGKASALAKDSLLGQVILLVVGFLLTTMAGAAISHVIQQRSWTNEWRLKRAEAELKETTDLFNEFSSLMDKRHYAMFRLNAALRERVPVEDAKNRLEDYRSILTEWNNRLNRNLALVEVYFGSRASGHVEIGIVNRFSSLSETLESMYRDKLDGKPVEEPSRQQNGRHLDQIKTNIYMFNIDAAQKIRELRDRLMEPS